MSVHLWTSGTRVGGDLVVERELGRGGMGAVFLLRSNLSGARFAAKRMLVEDPTKRLEFLRELEAWIDLPDHVNVVSFRFFRSVGREIAIFAEYVDGRTLDDWIKETETPSVAAMLDLALQIARGLAVAHDAGLVHHDVKPSNVLVAPSGVAKLTDFGLARARHRGMTDIDLDSRERGGMTPAFCSPEQAEGRATSRATDIWSWGLSVLQLFNGELTWGVGQVAPQVLEGYLASGPSRVGLPKMPPGLATILARCFEADTDRRWKAFNEVIPLLEAELQGQGVAVRPVEKSAAKRAFTQSRQWADPSAILAWIRALEGDGRPVERLGGSSSRVAAIADLAAYEEAKELVLSSVVAATPGGREALASIYLELALIYDALGDVGGAGAAAFEAESQAERLGVASPEVARSLGMRAQMEMGEAFRRLGKLDDAHGALTRATKMLGTTRAPEDAGWLALYWARLHRDRGDAFRAADSADHAATQWGVTLRSGAGAHIVEPCLEALLLAGEKWLEMRDGGRASVLLHRAVDAFETEPLRSHPRGVVFVGLLQLAIARVGDADPKVVDATRARHAAMTAWDATREDPAWEDHAADLLTMLIRSATASGGPDIGGVLQRVLAMREQFVVLEGRADLAHRLAEALLIGANLLNTSGQYAQGLPFVERALELWHRLVNRHNRPDLRGWLLAASMNRQFALSRVGRRHDAWLELERSATEAKGLALEGADDLLYLLDELRLRRFCTGLLLAPSTKRRLRARLAACRQDADAPIL